MGKRFAFLFILFVLSSNSYSMVANPFLKKVKQPDGKVLSVRYVGNEWNNYLIDNRGKILVRNKNGYWIEKGNYFNEKNSPSLPRYFRDNPLNNKEFTIKNLVQRKLRANFEKRRQNIDGVLNKNTLKSSAYTHPVLVILVEFSNFSHIGTESKDWARIFFGEEGKSIRAYYREVSYGKADIVPVEENFNENDGVVGWITLPYPHPDTGGDITLENLRIASDAIKQADNYVDFSLYDRNGDGIISSGELSIFIVVAGYEASYSPQYNPSIWGHKGYLFSQLGYPGVFCDGVLVGEFSNDPAKSGGYVEIGEWQQSDETDGHMATIGIMCHELAHDMYGIIDLYDIDYSTYGIGCFGLMGAGAWGMSEDDNFPGETPVHFCAWSKIFCGFLSPFTVSKGEIYLNFVEKNADIKKILTPIKGEYFLLENRQQKGFDKGLYGFFRENGGGIAVWHIIENAYNNSQDFYRKVDLVSARRCVDESSFFDLGKRQDLFYKGNNPLLTPDSIPSSGLSKGVDSRVMLTDFSPSSDQMTVKLAYSSPDDFDTEFKTISSSGTDSYVSIAVDRERNLIFALNLQNGFQVFKISENKLTLIARVNALGSFVKCIYDKGFLYIIDAKGKALIYNVEDEYNPHLVSELKFVHQSVDFAISGDYLYISVGDGFLIVDVSDKSNPKIVYQDYSFVAVIGIAVKDNAMYLASYSGMYIHNENRGILVFDISKKDHPEFVKRIDTGDETKCAIVYENYLLAGNGPYFLYDISDPLSPDFIKKTGITGTFWNIYGQDLIVSTYNITNGTVRCYDLNEIPDLPLKWSVFKIVRCFAELGEYFVFEENDRLKLSFLRDFEANKIVNDVVFLGKYGYSPFYLQDGNNFYRNDSDKTYAVSVVGDSFSEVKNIPFDRFYVKDNVFYTFEYNIDHYLMKVFSSSSDLERFQYRGRMDTDFKVDVFPANSFIKDGLLFVPGIIEKNLANGNIISGIDIFDVSLEENPIKKSLVVFDTGEVVFSVCSKDNFLYVITFSTSNNNINPDYFIYSVSIENIEHPVILEKNKIEGIGNTDSNNHVMPVFWNFYQDNLLLLTSDGKLKVFEINSDGKISLKKEISLAIYSTFFNRMVIDGNSGYIPTSNGILKINLDNLNAMKMLPIPYFTNFVFLNRDYLVSFDLNYGYFILINRLSWETDITVLDSKSADKIIMDFKVEGDKIFYVTGRDLVKLKIEGDEIKEEKRVPKSISILDYSENYSRWSHMGIDNKNIYIFSRVNRGLVFDVFDKESLENISESYLDEDYTILKSNVSGKDVFMVVSQNDGCYLIHYSADDEFNLQFKGSIKLTDRPEDFFYSIKKIEDFILVNDFFKTIFVVKIKNSGELDLVNKYINQSGEFLQVRGNYVFLCGYGLKMYTFENGNLNLIDCFFDNFYVSDVYFNGTDLTVVFENVLRKYRYENGKFIFSGKYYLNPAVDTDFIEKREDKFLLFDLINASRLWVVKEFPKIKINSFDADKTKGKIPLTVSFSLDISGGSNNVKYHWDFEGDGDFDLTTDVPFASYTYSKQGVYTPRVKIEDEKSGDVLSASLKIKVYKDRPYIFPLNFSPFFNSVDLSIINSTEDEQSISIELMDFNGHVLSSIEKLVPSLGSMNLSYGNTNGYLKIESAEQLVITATLKSENRRAGFNVDNFYRDRVYIPHIAEETNFWDNLLFVSTFNNNDFLFSVKCGDEKLSGITGVYNVNDFVKNCNCSNCVWGKLEAKQFNPLGENDSIAGYQCFIKKNSDGAGYRLMGNGSTRLFIPHIPLEKDLFWTGLSIVNLSDVQNRVIFRFFNPDGIELENEYVFIFDKNEKLKGTIKQLFENLPYNAVSCIIEAEYPMAGCEIYGTYSKGIAGFNLPAIPSKNGFFYLKEGENLWNGVAIFNPLNRIAIVAVSLRDKDGVEKGSLTIKLNPFAHSQFVVKDVFGLIDIGDYLEINSNSPVFAIGVRGDKNYNTMNTFIVNE